MVGWAGRDRAARPGPVGLGPARRAMPPDRAMPPHRARREPRGTQPMGGLAAGLRRVRLVAEQGPVRPAPTGPAPVGPASPARDAPARGSGMAPDLVRLHLVLDPPAVRAVLARVRRTARPDQGPSCRASAWPGRAVARKADRPRARVGSPSRRAARVAPGARPVRWRHRRRDGRISWRDRRRRHARLCPCRRECHRL